MKIRIALGEIYTNGIQTFKITAIEPSNQPIEPKVYTGSKYTPKKKKRKKNKK